MAGDRDSTVNHLETYGTVEWFKRHGANDDDTLRQDERQVGDAVALSKQRDKPPATVQGYSILRCLGDGAYGSVWLAREDNTGKQVAVKFYTHRRGLDWSLLNREVEKLAVLYTSRNIVRLLDVGWDSDPPYYVMEFLENGSLGSFLTEGPLPAHEAVRIAASVLQALVHAHGSGILHCDLKPANVLLDSEFEPRLCDFGQSRLSDEQKPALGTLFYMAPEQADLKAVPDARWDVYALGALLYHMLCGLPPYRSPENEELIQSTERLEDRLAVYRRILRQSPKPTLHRKMPGVDKRLAEIVDRCLQVDPKKRYPNAQAVLDALEMRERQRSRRPMMALGILGPGLLLMAMTPIIYRALQNAESQARASLTERALESEALPARILARSLLDKVHDRQSQLSEIASRMDLREAVAHFATLPLAERGELNKVIGAIKLQVDTEQKALGRELDTSWFLTDADGYQRWREPPVQRTMDVRFNWRDYYHGRDIQYPPDKVPDDVKPIEEPHISIPFRSDATNRFMVAISVPIWDEKHEKVIGVLARTTHLGQLLAEYGRSIQTENRIIALVDGRNWHLLDHPWMTPENVGKLISDRSESAVDTEESRRASLAAYAKLKLPDETIEKLERLETAAAANQDLGTDDRDEHYKDPVATLDPKEYSGEWLAAFSPVGQYGWTVIVQERKTAAQRPLEQMRSDMLRYGLWALVVGTALIGLLWYFVLRAMNEREFRVSPGRLDSFRSPSSLTTISDR